MEDVESIKQRLLSKIADKKMYINDKQRKYYKLDLVERIINRLASFSGECQECTDFLNDLEPYIDSIRVNVDKQTDKAYQTYVSKITLHLQSKHKLVNDNYYLTVFMPVGMLFGVAFGTIGSFKGISSSGIGIGLCIGVAIGAGLDADAKKKGRVI